MLRSILQLVVSLMVLKLFVTTFAHGQSSQNYGYSYNHFEPIYAEKHSSSSSSSYSNNNDKCAQIVPHEEELLGFSTSQQPAQSKICIPISFINYAFTKARYQYGLQDDQLPFHSTNLDKSLNEIDQLGHILLETSRIIATKFHLDVSEIYNLLPRIDINQTEIANFCPFPILRPGHLNCKIDNTYRTLSGHCNNIYHPNWGAAFIPFQNFLPPVHQDRLSDPREYGISGLPLPSPRLVSQLIHQNPSIMHDHAITTMLIAWGQIIDHDITLTADTQDPNTFREPECCQQTSHHNCLPIQIPTNDPFYSNHGQYCMNFARSLAGLRSDCRLGTRKAFNRISSYLDGSFIYGTNLDQSNSELREGQYGLLKSLPAFNKIGLKELLPLKINDADDGCIRGENSNQHCFLAGDIRVNEQLILTVLHTIFMREHNRIAKELFRINPHWDDERLFQETRRIIIAIIQQITFNEFLPMTLGKSTMEKYGLILEERGYYWDGYDPGIDATAAEEFITSAFRFGHSLLPHKIERWSHGHHFIDSQQLHRLLRQPFDLYKPGFLDTYVLGLVNQLAQSMDEGVTNQVTTLLFKKPKQHFGMDLASINIQRGREHGVPSYTAYRELCKLSPIYNWFDLLTVFKNETISKYKSIYSSPHDIDLWSGGISEIPETDSLLGATFNCLIARQFYLLRAGDRFWYELPNMKSSFTIEQLDEIRISTLSRLLCDNTDHVKTIQLYAMVYPDLVANPRVSCKGQIIPRINLERWREFHTSSPSEEPFSHEFLATTSPIHHQDPRNNELLLDNNLLLLSRPKPKRRPSSSAATAPISFNYEPVHLQHQQHQSQTQYWHPSPSFQPYSTTNNNNRSRPYTQNHSNSNSYDYDYHYYQHDDQMDFNSSGGYYKPNYYYYNQSNNDHQQPSTSYTATNNNIGSSNSNSSSSVPGSFNEGLGNFYMEQSYNQHHPQKYQKHHYEKSNHRFQPIIGDLNNHNIYDNSLIIKQQPPQKQKLLTKLKVLSSSSYSSPNLTLATSLQPPPPLKKIQKHHHQQYNNNDYQQSSSVPLQLLHLSQDYQPSQHNNNDEYLAQTENLGHGHDNGHDFSDSEPKYNKPIASLPSKPNEPFVINDIAFIPDPTPINEEKSVISNTEMPTPLLKFARRHYPLKRRHYLPRPYPNSPFPGWDGLFSPNPGYLVRQKFYRVYGR